MVKKKQFSLILINKEKVMKKVVERKEVNGKLKLTLLGYPSTFYGCLDMIAKNKLNVPGKVYDCIRNYINEYRSIISTLKEVVEI